MHLPTFRSKPRPCDSCRDARYFRREERLYSRAEQGDIPSQASIAFEEQYQRVTRTSCSRHSHSLIEVQVEVKSDGFSRLSESQLQTHRRQKSQPERAKCGLPFFLPSLKRRIFISLRPLQLLVLSTPQRQSNTVKMVAATVCD